ncbi:MAG TPA: hypothetical protein VIG33_11615 [Pseudobdellovibrionaceae bacterium]|jgi:hypothetical protein
MAPQKSPEARPGRSELYKNLSGVSGILRFKINRDSIEVEFHDGAVYLYDEAITGRVHVERMKELARAGKGLNSYISRAVRKNYARKLK